MVRWGKTLPADAALWLSDTKTPVLREDIARGQFVERVTVEGLSGGKWWELARATTIGRKRILKWPLRNLNGLRVTLHKTRGELHLLPAELYRVAW